MYSPENVCRPDGIVMLNQPEDKPRLALTVGSAVYYGKVPSEKVTSQLLSMDLAKSYYKADGKEVNPGA